MRNIYLLLARSFSNPFLLYVWGFLLSILVYSLRWTKAYDNLSLSLLIFFIITFFISFLCSFLVKSKNVFTKIPCSSKNGPILFVFYIGIILEFIFFGYIPLISAISGAITYGDFTGIKGFHFVLYSSLFVYSIYLFHQFISQKSFKLFLLFMLSVLPHLLVINRGGLMLIVSSCLVIIIMKKGYIKFKMFLKLIIFSLVLLSLFGIMGNLRSKYSRSDDNYILDVGGATPEFRNSIIPKVYFWSYIYIASPLGNLQYIIDYRDVSDFGVVDLIDFGVNATMPNFVSKRISPYLKTKFHSTDNYLVIKAFNVATMYFIPYYILGWWGLILMYLFVISVVISYVIFVKDSSRYFITGWSIICSIMLFSMFSNMWSSMGLTSVIIVFVLSFFERVRIKF